jgi:cell division protein FtsB
MTLQEEAALYARVERLESLCVSLIRASNNYASDLQVNEVSAILNDEINSLKKRAQEIESRLNILEEYPED